MGTRYGGAPAGGGARLFARQGFEQTTAAQIAAAVGLDRRTFLRHFPDKRDVLFLGRQELEGVLVAAVEQAPPGKSPMSLIGAALAAAADLFVDLSRERVRAAGDHRRGPGAAGAAAAQ